MMFQMPSMVLSAWMGVAAAGLPSTQGSPAQLARSCRGIIDQQFAAAFAAEWIAGWNSHNLDRIMEHYADEFEMRSPGVVTTVAEPTGIVKGKANVRAYWDAALKAQPMLRFEFIDVYAGIQSVAIHYRSVGRYVVVEVLEFNSDCHVIRGSANRGTPEMVGR